MPYIVRFTVTALSCAGLCCSGPGPGGPPSLQVVSPIEGQTLTRGSRVAVQVLASNFQFIDWQSAPPAEGQGHYHVDLETGTGRVRLLESFRRRDELAIPVDALPGSATLWFSLVSTDEAPLSPPVETALLVTLRSDLACLYGEGGRNVAITEILFDPDPLNVCPPPGTPIATPQSWNVQVELVNRGATDQTLDGWALCAFPNYWLFPTGTVIAAGARLVVHSSTGTNDASNIYYDPSRPFDTWGCLDPDRGGELALYRNIVANDPSEYVVSDNMVAYVEWRTAGHMRESVAVGANLWEFASALDMAGYVAGDGIASNETGICVRNFCVESRAQASLGAANPGTVCPMR